MTLRAKFHQAKNARRSENKSLARSRDFCPDYTNQRKAVPVVSVLTDITGTSLVFPSIENEGKLLCKLCLECWQCDTKDVLLNASFCSKTAIAA